MKVGDWVWVFDENRREYAPPPRGRIWGALVYRGHFRPVPVEGETRVSWILQGGRRVNKKTLAGVYLTEASVDEACWVHQHKHRIGDAVRRVDDAATLRKVAALVGYREEAEP